MSFNTDLPTLSTMSCPLPELMSFFFTNDLLKQKSLEQTKLNIVITYILSPLVKIIVTNFKN